MNEPYSVSSTLDELWQAMLAEAMDQSEQEPVLASFYHASILNHSSFACALAFQLSSKLDCRDVPAMFIRDVIEQAFNKCPCIIDSAAADILANRERDPACDQFLMPLLFFKGFHALQVHRIAHCLWDDGRTVLARFFQNRSATLFGVDIHPAVSIGEGIMLDHATGIVIGETARIGNNVSMLHHVTLGGTGTGAGKRHPQVSDGVLLAVGATLLGPIDIGVGAKIAAGSLVLNDVPAHTTVAGVPAKIVGKPTADEPSRDMDQGID